MKLHEIRCHFHEVSSSIKLAASAASGGAEKRLDQITYKRFA